LHLNKGAKGAKSLSLSGSDTSEAKSVRIRRTEDFFHRIYQQVATGIAITDWQGVFQQCNPAYCALLGYTERELRTIDFASLIHPEDREANLVQVRRLQVGEIPSFDIENRYIHKSGKPVWVHKFVSVLHAEEGKTTHLIALVTNITKRKVAEEALRESEERLRLAAQTGRMFAFSWDAATDIIERSGESAEILGVAQGAVTTGAEVFAMVYPADKELLEAAMAKLTVETPRLQITHRMIRPDGAVIWLERNIRAYFDEHGKVKRINGMVLDVTERKGAEEAIKESEQRFRLVADAAPVLIWMSGRDKLCTYFNKPWLNFTGRSMESELGNGWAEGVHREDLQRCMDTYIQAFDRRAEFQMEYRLRRYDGEYRWVFDIGAPRYSQDRLFAGYIGSCIDVTERKQAEEALRKSEERLRMAQWAAHIGTFDLNIRTGVDAWPPETEALYGLPPGGFGGTLTAFENLIHPDDRQRVVQLTHEMMRTGKPAEAEWRVVWPDGSVHWIASRGQVLMDESGEPSRMLGVNIDISERKRAEESLFGMTRKLIEAQEQERARIARELHDDINQRLAILAVGLDQLRTKHDDLPREVRDRMHELQQQTEDISTDLQALSHELHSSKLEYLGLVRSLRSWCAEFSERQKLEIDFKSHDVQSSPPQDISLCLFRVLQEAVHNAAKHSGARRIEVQLTENSGEIYLIVSDLGKGFNIEAARQGRGLGLTSMQERVRLVGGTIVIDSKLLCGTTIEVRLPFGAGRGSQKAAR
jgi:PAS domain S-box-containing protein